MCLAAAVAAAAVQLPLRLAASTAATTLAAVCELGAGDQQHCVHTLQSQTFLCIEKRTKESACAYLHASCLPAQHFWTRFSAACACCMPLAAARKLHTDTLCAVLCCALQCWARLRSSCWTRRSASTCGRCWRWHEVRSGNMMLNLQREHGSELTA